eukprot:CAMPEP_0202029704 /NCGR_PEP_ID=MMETSP0905-20130828/64118_1 /ASSEMBLY_ACC=CAM_ASM_000554 /TAXON_ID=420261 /ORGANISM="Thalassiosira antarctica, Strain CCMP982" /LENGTH=414 /DNA_ID=CAMNT_0048593479 /DNA_START=111 /DNA_END=1356 /DNA_ORIENTATION=-
MKFQLLPYAAALATLIAAPVASKESAPLVGTAGSLKGVAFPQQVAQVIHVLKGQDKKNEDPKEKAEQQKTSGPDDRKDPEQKPDKKKTSGPDDRKDPEQPPKKKPEKKRLGASRASRNTTTIMKFQLLPYAAALATLIAAPVASKESAPLVGTAGSLKGVAFPQQVAQVIHVLKGQDKKNEDPKEKAEQQKTSGPDDRKDPEQKPDKKKASGPDDRKDPEQKPDKKKASGPDDRKDPEGPPKKKPEKKKMPPPPPKASGPDDRKDPEGPPKKKPEKKKMPPPPPKKKPEKKKMPPPPPKKKKGPPPPPPPPPPPMSPFASRGDMYKEDMCGPDKMIEGNDERWCEAAWETTCAPDIITNKRDRQAREDDEDFCEWLGFPDEIRATYVSVKKARKNVSVMKTARKNVRGGAKQHL